MLKVALQKQYFTLDCYVLKLKGVDLVLGVEWLQTSGPITMNYKDLIMQISYLGKKELLYKAKQA